MNNGGKGMQGFAGGPYAEGAGPAEPQRERRRD